ncbi:hypothetical protein TSAR_005166 [Trichomalopsis sarcophagae]|uniref:Uncharacterized protein n=1 Tax=Trichomalopsis sarcophagae TaxID=543379 RepID=A0A232EL73_9HYME|nr:hypothetical protein TSAR_005166 [Trichomalopsis sarcophagae]
MVWRCYPCFLHIVCPNACKNLVWCVCSQNCKSLIFTLKCPTFRIITHM